MRFVDIPQGASVFVDANALVYHFSQHPILAPPCTELLDRIARHEIAGATSADVLSDVAHRLMALEALTLLGWSGPGITNRLRRHPGEIQRLTRFRQAVLEIPQFGVHVFSVTGTHIESATDISQKFGLLSGDALIIAIMQANGQSLLASHDADFDRVIGITRYAPI